MSQHNEIVWTKLENADLINGTVPKLDTTDSPWFVKVLLGFSGWLAAIFLLGFLGVGFEFIFQNNGSAFVLGMVIISGAFGILKTSKSDFFEHFALAVSLAGQGLVLWSIFDMASEKNAYWGVALLQIVLTVFMPHFIHRVFSSCAAVFCCSMTLFFMGFPYILSGLMLFALLWIWLNEFKFTGFMKPFQATGYGIVLALIILKGTTHFNSWWFWRTSYLPSDHWGQIWMGEILAGVALLFLVAILLVRYNQVITGKIGIAIVTAILIIAIMSIKATGVTTGIIILVLGLYGSNRILTGLGIASLLLNISAYYYTLDTTLLEKSKILFVVGIVLIGIRWFGKNAISPNEEVENAS